MVGKMVKKWGKVFSFMNYFCILHVLVKIKEVKLKNLHILACLNLSYGTTKRKTKMERLQRWWDLSKPGASLVLVILSAS